MARIALSAVAPDAFFQLSDTSRFRRLCPEQSPMNFLCTEAAGTADKYLVSIIVPFEDRTRGRSEPKTCIGNSWLTDSLSWAARYQTRKIQRSGGHGLVFVPPPEGSLSDSYLWPPPWPPPPNE